MNRADYPRLVALADQHNLWTTDRGNYPGLFGVGNGTTTFVLPDWRGVAIRFVDDGRGLDTDRGGKGIGSYEADEFKSHTHTQYGSSAWYSGGSTNNCAQAIYLILAQLVALKRA